MTAYIVWPLVVMVVLQRIWWSLADPTPGRFLDLYDASFRFLNPHTVSAVSESLSPGAVILTGPWAILDPDQARWVQLGLSVLALLGAWVLLLRLLQIPMRSVLAPVFLLAGFYCGPVTDTLLTITLGHGGSVCTSSLAGCAVGRIAYNERRSGSAADDWCRSHVPDCRTSEKHAQRNVCAV
jgi:arabinofuranan 3-O-arabinosyltransferase